MGIHYIPQDKLPAAVEAGFDPDSVGSIHRSGSVAGMRKKYGWPNCGQVRSGAFIYNVGPDMVQKLWRLNLLKPAHK